MYPDITPGLAVGATKRHWKISVTLCLTLNNPTAGILIWKSQKSISNSDTCPHRYPELRNRTTKFTKIKMIYICLEKTHYSYKTDYSVFLLSEYIHICLTQCISLKSKPFLDESYQSLPKPQTMPTKTGTHRRWPPGFGLKKGPMLPQTQCHTSLLLWSHAKCFRCECWILDVLELNKGYTSKQIREPD